MAIASARDSRVVRNGTVESFNFGDQAFPILIRNMKGGATLFVSLAGVPDPEATAADGDTIAILPGEYWHTTGGGAGAYTLNYALAATEARTCRVQVVELGAAVNVDPGVVGGRLETMEISPIADAPSVVNMGAGLGPLLIVNNSAIPVFFTVNSGTDPDTSYISTDTATFELDGDDFVVLAATGTPYEVRAQLPSYGSRRASLQLVEVV